MEAIIFLLVLGIILGLMIAVAGKFFAVEQDPRLETIEELLPGANCGGCGFAGCSDFAKALIANKATPDKCAPMNSENAEKVAEVLGVSAGDSEPQVAVVLCGGDSAKAKDVALYNGVNDCRSAMLVSKGAKGCQYGCLGLASCARACQFNAIEITDKGLAVVHPELCVGCGNCVAACPRDLIKMVPKSVKVHIYCNSPAKGAEKRKVCSASCIGCRKCLKASEEGQITMDGFLARINYDNPPKPEVADVCPTKCLQSIIKNKNEVVNNG